jgi:hypothetical protein
VPLVGKPPENKAPPLPELVHHERPGKKKGNPGEKSAATSEELHRKMVGIEVSDGLPDLETVYCASCGGRLA